MLVAVDASAGKRTLTPSDPRNLAKACRRQGTAEILRIQSAKMFPVLDEDMIQGFHFRFESGFRDFAAASDGV